MSTVSAVYSAVLPPSLMLFCYGDNLKSTSRACDVFKPFSHLCFNRGRFSFWMSKCCLFFLILSLQILKQGQQDCQRSPVFCAFEICPSFCAMHFYFKQIFSFWKIGSIQNPPVPSNSKSNQQCGYFTIISAISKGFCLDASGKSPSAS